MAPTRSRFVSVLTLLLGVSFTALASPPVAAQPPRSSRPPVDRVVLFAADGLRQDLVEAFVAEGSLPAMAPPGLPVRTSPWRRAIRCAW